MEALFDLVHAVGAVAIHSHGAISLRKAAVGRVAETRSHWATISKSIHAPHSIHLGRNALIVGLSEGHPVLARTLRKAAHVSHELSVHASAVSVGAIHVAVVKRILNHGNARLGLEVKSLSAGARSLGQAPVLGIKLS